MASFGHVLYVVLPLLCVSVSFPGVQAFQEYGRVTPSDPFVFEGGSLVLYCNITNEQVRENSTLLYFDRTTKNKNGSIHSTLTEILTTKAIRMRLPRIVVEDEGTYVCKQRLHGGGRPRIIGHQFVTVDRRPKPVENISCIVYNWQNMTCTWDLGVAYQHLKNVSVSLVYAEVKNQYDCPELTKTSCTWPQDHYQHGHSYKINIIVKYIFMQKEMMKVQTGTQRIQTKLLALKPDPVTDLKAMVLNSTCVQLEWAHNKAVSRKDEMFFIGQYKSQWSHRWNDMLTMQGQLKTVVCHLIPFTNYQFEMYVLPPPEHSPNGKEQGYSSEPAFATAKTFEDVPVGAPRMCPGCFYCRDSKMCESATIYWKDMPPPKRQGIITRYRLELRSDNQPLFNVTRMGMDLYSTTLDLPAEVPVVEVRITPGTSVGFGLVSSAILIPTADRRPKPPSMFLVQTHKGPEKVFYLSWADMSTTRRALELKDGQKKEVRDRVDGTTKEVYDDGQNDRVVERVTSLFVVWCEGSRMAFDCDSDIQWHHLPPDQVTFELDLRNMTAHKEMILIGITKEVTREGRNYSSGIHWADCVYFLDHAPPRPPENVRFAKEQSPSQLYVVWDKIDCGVERAYVTEYQVEYCRVSMNGTFCAEAPRKKNVSSLKGEAVLRELQPNNVYLVRVRAVSSSGNGDYSSPVKQLVIPPDDSSNSRQDDSKKILIGAIVSVISLFFVIFIAFFFWRCQRRKKKLKDEIVPYAETNNLGCSTKNNPFRKSESSSEDNGSENSHHPLIGAPHKDSKKQKKVKQNMSNGVGGKPLLKPYDDVISMETVPSPPPSIPPNLQHLRKPRDVHDSKLSDINEERDSPSQSSGRGSLNTKPKLSDPGSSGGGSSENYFKAAGYDDSGDSNDADHQIAIVQPARSVSVFPAFHVAPRPMLGTSSLGGDQGRAQARRVPLHTFSGRVGIGSNSSLKRDAPQAPSPASDGYQPNGTMAERAETPVWHLREDAVPDNDNSGESASGPPGVDYSRMNISEAPTLERGREGLLNGMYPHQESPNDADPDFPAAPTQDFVPSPAPVEKLGGYFYPNDTEGFHKTPPTSGDSHKQNCFDSSIPTSNSEFGPSSKNSDFNQLSTDDSGGSVPYVIQTLLNGGISFVPPSKPNDPNQFPNGEEGHENGSSSQPDYPDSRLNHEESPSLANGYLPLSLPTDHDLYLTPIDTLSPNNSSSPPPLPLSPVPNLNLNSHHRHSVPSTDRDHELNEGPVPTSPPFHRHGPPPNYPPPQPPSLEVDKNGFAEDVPPKYPAPPPPRNPRLTALAIPDNINRPLSGVLLDLPLQYYQDPQTDGSSDIQTEL